MLVREDKKEFREARVGSGTALTPPPPTLRLPREAEIGSDVWHLFPPFPPGLPDPPVDVQVEPGPQDGSLLVTWLPVTLNSTGGTSNGAPVTGYAVYADGKKVTEVESPTGMCVCAFVCLFGSNGFVFICVCV